ncbi:MAG: ankyrin repeat domain-containing protein, partial [Proteobacteria bacterium]|nr:ankyrin repeat domain-containing protein [Pseudomonadota bacterium]
MKNKYLIKRLSIFITLAMQICATDHEQSEAILLSEILVAPLTTKPGPAIYTATKEEIYEIECLRKDSTINWQLFSKNTDNQKSKKAKKKIIQDVMHKLEVAAASGKQALVAFLLTQKLKYSQNRALRFAAMNEQLTMVEFLLNRPIQLRPSQEGINTAIKSAAFYGKKNMVEFLLNWKEQPQASKLVINWALLSASSNNQLAMVEFLLNRTDGEFRPNQYGIIDAYREAVANSYMEIIRILTPHVPEEERQTQAGPHRGMAYEIHNYTNTQVTANEASDSSTETAKPVKLIDAVWDNINVKLKDVNIITYDNARLTIEQAIEKFIPTEQKELATQAALHRLESDVDYEHKLSVAITFIQTFHEDKMEHWVNGFVLESIEAYKNSSNSTSCSKGILERIATGFRGINPELDK